MYFYLTLVLNERETELRGRNVSTGWIEGFTIRFSYDWTGPKVVTLGRPHECNQINLLFRVGNQINHYTSVVDGRDPLIERQRSIRSLISSTGTGFVLFISD